MCGCNVLYIPELPLIKKGPFYLHFENNLINRNTADVISHRL